MYPLIRSVLFARSRNDAEKAHEILVRWAQKIQASPTLLQLIDWCHSAHDNPQPVRVAGITFPNRVGLAAGFDKQAEMLPLMQALGFGFVEVGTVLPRPQTGQPRPRLFREPREHALINRYGFNSDGVNAVCERLEQVRSQIRIPIGGSIGIMKDTVPTEAVLDATTVLAKLRKHVSYLVWNISSPNTPKLRELQSKRYLEAQIRQLVDFEEVAATAQGENPRPIFVKLAPDLDVKSLNEAVEAAEHGGASGFIMGNTTLTRPLRDKSSSFAKEPGGLSGDPLFALTKTRVYSLSRKTSKPIIAAGGIGSAYRAKEMFDSGAILVQILSCFVYEGPRLITKIRHIY